MGSFLKGDITGYDTSSPYLAGYKRPSDTPPVKVQTNSIYDKLFDSEYFKKQADKASEVTKEMGYVNGLQYDPWDADLSGKAIEPKLDQRMTYDPMDLGTVDYLGKAVVAGPNLGYEPEDLYQGETPEDNSFRSWLERNAKKYGPSLLSAAAKPSTKQAQPQSQSISPRGSAANYAAPGRLGAGPFAPVNPRPDYQTLAQNAFRNALVEYILKNPKQNIKGML